MHIGFPVVVKAVGRAHKSDGGGVILGVDTAGAVSAAARVLVSAGDGSASVVALPADRSVLVEEFVRDAVAELLVSVRPAPPVGMLLTLGAGGTLTELLDDTASVLLPVTADEINQVLRSLRIWPLFAGYRGRRAGALDTVVEAVGALSSLVCDDPSIVEAEINPLLVTPHAAIAVDALMLVDESTNPGVPADA